ncbi:hypothetical protein FKP32DRAFT_1609788 [Trametes sanguinea]|nr:hypothetical protein FKP32DRAFT_1609788 [Trametes sanguinea]
MPPPLPQLVVDGILNAVEDREALCSCALVCRQWLTPSRYNLFYDVCLARRSSFDTFVQVRDAPHIASAFENIHSLRLVDDREQPWLHLFPLIFSPTRFPRTFFMALNSFAWDKLIPTQSFYTAWAQFDSLSTLDLSHGMFFSFADFCRLVCAFRNLARLFVNSVGWEVTALSPPESPQPLPRPRLQLFWFTPVFTNAVPPLVEWLLSTPSVETLTDLQIGGQDKENLVDVQRLTRHLGSRLEHFQVFLKAWTDGVSLDLSQNTSLRSMQVREIDASSSLYLAPFLDRLSPENLSDLTFHISISGLCELHCLRLRWARIVDILLRNDFLALRVLAVWVRRAPPAEEISLLDLMDEVRSWMNPLDARVFVRVSPWYTLVR